MKSEQMKPILICFGIPAAIMAAAYIYMALRYNTVWLFPVVVHENGKYTLLETIFYFRHFLWKVPIKTVYAVFTVGFFHFYGHVNRQPSPEKVVSGWLLFSCWGAVAVFSFISIMAAVKSVGLHKAMTGLLQYRTSEMRPILFGSHWRNHFLSNIVLFSFSALFLLFHRKGHWNRNRTAILYYFACAVFILCSLFFGITGDPFFTPRYILHQLREIIGSDIPVTLFLAMGTLLLIDSLYHEQNGRSAVIRKWDKTEAVHWIVWAVPAVSITLYLIVKTLIFKASGQIGMITGAKELPVFHFFAWHVFEHTLDYVFIVLLVSALYLTTLKIDKDRVQNTEVRMWTEA